MINREDDLLAQAYEPKWRPTAGDVDRLWAGVEKEISAPIVGSSIVSKDAKAGLPAIGHPSAKPGELRPSIMPRYKHFGVPLAIAAAIAIGFFGIKYIQNTPQPIPDTKTYSTAPAQRANITLADGSRVTLAPVTTMRVTMSEAGRAVDLNGEAVFTVTTHSNAPFTVKAGNTTTRVLGTRFGVRAYNDDQSIRVAVADGRVSVTSSTLAAGDVATVSNTGGKTVITRNEDVDNLLYWTSGRLAFRSDSLATVARQLARWYGVGVQIATPELAAIPVTTVVTTEPASVVIPAIAEAAGLTVTRRGAIYLLERAP